MSRLAPEFFTDTPVSIEIRNNFEYMFRQYGVDCTFHYLPSVMRVCIIYYNKGQADLAREQLHGDSIEGIAV
ncbi:hypothetical protein, partial [Salmonella sp. s51228]|uniref:hypothetical protein n=1 Tax=Salmonella sp. s51228 TaxID=3159652 RepID=UPI003980CEDA